MLASNVYERAKTCRGMTVPPLPRLLQDISCCSNRPEITKVLSRVLPTCSPTFSFSHKMWKIYPVSVQHSNWRFSVKPYQAAKKHLYGAGWSFRGMFSLAHTHYLQASTRQMTVSVRCECRVKPRASHIYTYLGLPIRYYYNRISWQIGRASCRERV